LRERRLLEKCLVQAHSSQLKQYEPHVPPHHWPGLYLALQAPVKKHIYERENVDRLPLGALAILAREAVATSCVVLFELRTK
jgi:hypothetical protein